MAAMKDSDLRWAGDFTVTELLQLARQLKLETKGTKLRDLAHWICNEIHRHDLKLMGEGDKLVAVKK
jgi:hypothetical protein